MRLRVLEIYAPLAVEERIDSVTDEQFRSYQGPNCSTIKEVWLDESQAKEWFLLYRSRYVRDNQPNRTPEEIEEDDKESAEELREMEDMENVYLKKVQRVLLRTVSLMSDTALYREACDMAVRWAEQHVLAQSHLRGFLRALQSAASDGPEQITGLMKKNIEEVLGCTKTENFVKTMTSLLRQLESELSSYPRRYPLLFEDQPTPLRVVVLRKMQMEFVQHFVAHLLYVLANKGDI